MADVKTEPADIEEIATIIEEHDVKKGESKISKVLKGTPCHLASGVP